MNNLSDYLANVFLSITDMFGFKQLVQHPTHNGGNMLDLVLTRGVDNSDLVVSPYASALSDNFLLTFQVVVSCPYDDCQATYSCHRITPATTAAMADNLPLSHYEGSVDRLTDDFNIVLSSASDPAAPLIFKKGTTKRPTLWFDEDTHTLKQSCRKLE